MAAVQRAFTVFKTRFSQRAHRSPVFRFMFIQYPQIGGGLISAFKAAGADYFAQTQVDTREYKKNGTLNYRRNFLFALLGFTHGGFINYFVHSIMNPFLFGASKHPWNIFKIIVFNQFIYTPSFAFPLFYGYKGLVYSNGDPKAAKDSIKLYLTTNIYKDVPMAAKVWGPAHIVTYTLIPRRYRVYWINFVSFAWTTILSSTRGGHPDRDKEDKQNEEKQNSNVSKNTNFSNNNNNSTSNSNNRDIMNSTAKTGLNSTKQIEIDDNENGIESIDANNKIIDPGNDISPVLKRKSK